MAGITFSLRRRVYSLIQIWADGGVSALEVNDETGKAVLDSLKTVKLAECVLSCLSE